MESFESVLARETAVILPTSRERELWAKALTAPEDLTDEEQREALRQPDSLTTEANVLQISGGTLAQLIYKALNDEESLTKEECNLFARDFHILKPRDALKRSELSWSREDRDTYMAVKQVLLPSDQRAARRAAILTTSSRAKPYTPISWEDWVKPVKWIQNVMEVGLPWGFLAFRDQSVKQYDLQWETYLDYVKYHCDKGLGSLKSVSEVRATKTIDWQDEYISADAEVLRRKFAALQDNDLVQPGLVNNTFLVLTADCMQYFDQQFQHPLSQGHLYYDGLPWIWAYEANFKPGSSSSGYEGKMRVHLESLFTWFYAVRLERTYSMETMWELAQTQPGQAWRARTSECESGSGLGNGHTPFVLKDDTLDHCTYDLQR